MADIFFVSLLLAYGLSLRKITNIAHKSIFDQLVIIGAILDHHIKHGMTTERSDLQLTELIMLCASF